VELLRRGWAVKCGSFWAVRYEILTPLDTPKQLHGISEPGAY
jgi:hypothetical protein